MVAAGEHFIFLTLAGSQAHGTAREGSDVDLRGVFIAPFSSRLSLFDEVTQYEGGIPAELTSAVTPRLLAHATAARGLDIKTECVLFDLARFASLCATANPNALEILFADERDWVFETPAWRRFHSERQRFLTKKVRQTFLGYALAQLKRIKSHRSWLLHPPTKRPTREEFGLAPSGSTLSNDDQNRIEQAIAEKIRSYGIDDIEMPGSVRIAVQERLGAFLRDLMAVPEEEIEERMRAVASHSLSVPATVMTALNAEKRYRAAVKHWESYQTWKAERNESRAELERRHGYDTKHAMHLIRLMRMGLEVLEHGALLVRRLDAAELNAIRDGALSYDDLMAAASNLEAEMHDAAARSALPADVDRDFVDQLTIELIREGARSTSFARVDAIATSDTVELR